MRDHIGFYLAALLGVVALAAASRAAPTPPDVQAVLHHYDALYRGDSSTGRVELSVIKPHQPTRVLRLRVWTKGKDKALIRIEAPEREAGTATLRVNNDIWNYLPHIARTIRVPPSMMLGAWMGSDFTNDDLVRESSWEKDFISRLDGRSTAPAGWKISLQARAGTVGLWNRIELIINDDGTLPVQAQYFDRKNRLARTMRFDEVKTFSGRTLPAHMTLTPADNPDQRTEMRYLDLTFNAAVPDSTFSLSQLEAQ